MIEALMKEIWQSLLANRVRAFLTMLGMVVGVGAVVLMVAIGEGVQDSVNRMISSMGSNLLMVLSGSASSGGIRTSMGEAPTLTREDADAIAELPQVKAVTPVIYGTLQMVRGSNNWSSMVAGVNPSYFDIREWEPESGSIFNDSDLRSATRVAVIGKKIADNIFGNEDPIGKVMRIKNTPYTVVGLLTSKGQSLDGRDQDDVVFVPISTAQRQLFRTKFRGMVRFVIVQSTVLEALNELIDPITDLLRQRHHLARHMENDFNIQNLTAIADVAMGTARLLAILLGAIASISLLVGGIGIMNIMLVSVTERTREIGIRSAIGARRRDILWQFLLEAVFISLVGCLIGVILGVGGAFLINLFFDLNIVISLQSILLAFFVAGGVGVFFGYYPARKAAYLKPIDALRYQ